MKKITVFSLLILLIAVIAGCSSKSESEKQQESYPTKAIQFIVPYQAGDNSDLSARTMADKVNSILAQPMVVINKPGGGGSIGAADVAKAAPDGYLLLNGSYGLVTAKPYMEDVGYTYEDFKPVAQFTEIPLALAVRKDAPYNSLQEFLDYAKENPGKIKYSVPGSGTIQHITMLSFANQLGIEMKALPYQGGGPALAALLAKDVEAAFVGAGVLVGQYESGDIKVLGATTKEHLSIMPDVSTFSEQGHDLFAGVWFGAFAPKDTPDEVIAVLENTFKQIYDMPEVQEQWKKLNLQPSFLNAQDFAQRVKQDAQRNYEILQELGKTK
ncbi:MAG: tripartite tricarboxylate transporter substrate binding protein [Peptococcaceae bacterium]